MTDEERKHLINSLRNYKGYDRKLTKLVHEAADGIERLAKELLIAEGALEICQGELNLTLDERKRLREDAECWRRQND